MFTRILLPLLALAGIALAVYTVLSQGKVQAPAPPVVEPASAPFQSYVAGAGLVEASTENIAVGTSVPGVVTELYAKAGDRLPAGAPLFKIDDRTLRAELAVREASLRVAEAELARLEATPRPETIPPAEARVREAESQLADARRMLELAQGVQDARALSEEELSRRRFAVDAAEARLAQARSDLALLMAGPWAPELEIARANVAAARAQAEATRTEIERLTVRSPVDATVLKVGIRPGEFVPAGATADPLVMLGNTDTLHVRVDVDENDAWRVRAGSPARAFVRGNPRLETPMRFVRFEPWVVPKRSLTGASTERVDTRVLQVIYAFDPKDLPVFVGQQMDVFIEAQPATGVKLGPESPAAALAD